MLDVLGLQRLLQQVVVLQVDHRHRDVVGRAPVERELLRDGRQRLGRQLPPLLGLACEPQRLHRSSRWRHALRALGSWAPNRSRRCSPTPPAAVHRRAPTPGRRRRWEARRRASATPFARRYRARHGAAMQGAQLGMVDAAVVVDEREVRRRARGTVPEAEASVRMNVQGWWRAPGSGPPRALPARPRWRARARREDPRRPFRPGSTSAGCAGCAVSGRRTADLRLRQPTRQAAVFGGHVGRARTAGRAAGGGGRGRPPRCSPCHRSSAHRSTTRSAARQAGSGDRREKGAAGAEPEARPPVPEMVGPVAGAGGCCPPLIAAGRSQRDPSGEDPAVRTLTNPW